MTPKDALVTKLGLGWWDMPEMRQTVVSVFSAGNYVSEQHTCEYTRRNASA